MKPITVILLLLFSCTSIYAQEHETSNVLRTGASCVIFARNNYKDKFAVHIGTQIAAEYSRKFSSVYSLDVTLFKQNYSGSSQEKNVCDTYEPSFFKSNSTGISIRNIFSPFKKASWLRLGIGGSAEYNTQFTSPNEGAYIRSRGMFYNVSLPVRFYILDTMKFDLYAYYEFTFAVDYSNNGKGGNSNFYMPYNWCGLMFGVKF